MNVETADAFQRGDLNFLKNIARRLSLSGIFKKEPYLLWIEATDQGPESAWLDAQKYSCQIAESSTTILKVGKPDSRLLSVSCGIVLFPSFKKIINTFPLSCFSSLEYVHGEKKTPRKITNKLSD